MHYIPKKTVAEIIKSGNHYCIGLKGNQPMLLKSAQLCAQRQAPLSVDYAFLDHSHSRLVDRHVRVFEAPAALSQAWPQLAAFAEVRRFGVRDGESFHRQSWFILSAVFPASQVARLIQNHRGTIENRLHWVKDVVQHEDDSLIQAAQPATVMAFLRSWAISIFRRAGYDSITRAMRLFKHDLPRLLLFL